jgi:hypothetical protein
MESFGKIIAPAVYCILTFKNTRQLLYYPFTPFFVLFGDVVMNPTSSTCFSDLQLLRKTSLYYSDFQKYHSAAIKLERVAESFTKIAETYVRQSLKRRGSHGNDEQNVSREAGEEVLDHPEIQLHNVPLIVRDSSYFNPDAMQPTPSPIQSEPILYFDDLTVLDPASLFSFFNYPSQEQDLTLQSPNNTDTVSTMNSMDSNTNSQSRLRQNKSTSTLVPSQYVSMQEVEMNAQRQFSNCTFDWLALEDHSFQDYR